MAPSAAWTAAVACSCVFLAGVCTSLPSSRCLVDFDAYAPQTGAAWFSRFWNTCAQCCNAVRVGEHSLRGKVVCGDPVAANDISGSSVLYVADTRDPAFEAGMLRLGASVVHAYIDNTDIGSPSVSVAVRQDKLTQTTLMTAIYRANRMKRLSVVSVECSMCEYALVDRHVARTLCSLRAQLLLQVVYPATQQWYPRLFFTANEELQKASAQVANVWKIMRAAGFVPFSKNAGVDSAGKMRVQYGLKCTA